MAPAAAEIGHAPAVKSYEFVAHASAVTCVCIGPRHGNIIATGGEDRRVNLWAVGRTEPLLSLAGHTHAITSLAMDGPEQLLVAGGSNGSLKLWDLEQAKAIRTLMGHRSSVCGSQFHPFGDFFASASTDGTVKVWDIKRKSSVLTLADPAGATTTCMQFSPDGKWLITASASNPAVSACVWDLTAGRMIHRFSASAAANQIAFHPRELVMATANLDGTVGFWDLESFAPISTGRPRVANSRLLFSPDGGHSIHLSPGAMSAAAWEPQWETVWSVPLDAQGIATGFHDAALVTTGDSAQIVAAAMVDSSVHVYRVEVPSLLLGQSVMAPTAPQDRGVSYDIPRAAAPERGSSSLSALAPLPPISPVWQANRASGLAIVSDMTTPDPLGSRFSSNVSMNEHAAPPPGGFREGATPRQPLSRSGSAAMSSDALDSTQRPSGFATPTLGGGGSANNGGMRPAAPLDPLWRSESAAMRETTPTASLADMNASGGTATAQSTDSLSATATANGLQRQLASAGSGVPSSATSRTSESGGADPKPPQHQQQQQQQQYPPMSMPVPTQLDMGAFPTPKADRRGPAPYECVPSVGMPMPVPMQFLTPSVTIPTPPTSAPTKPEVVSAGTQMTPVAPPQMVDHASSPLEGKRVQTGGLHDVVRHVISTAIGTSPADAALPPTSFSAHAPVPTTSARVSSATPYSTSSSQPAAPVAVVAPKPPAATTAPALKTAPALTTAQVPAPRATSTPSPNAALLSRVGATAQPLGLDLAEFARGSTRRVPLSTITLASVSAGHASIAGLMAQRLRTLESLRGGSWDPTNLKSLVLASTKTRSHAVWADMLRAFTLAAPRGWNLDVCVGVLPWCAELMFEPFEDYIEAACVAVQVILVNFAPLIQETLGSAVPQIGLDFSREERLQKCRSCKMELIQIKQIFEELSGTHGPIGTRIRAVSTVFPSDW